MVRIWCVPASELDRQHLLGEHAELHCIVGALLGKYQAYRNHPETLRFKDRIDQLYFRHQEQVQEMQKRGYKHNTPLPQSNQPYKYTREEYQRDHAELAKRQQKPDQPSKRSNEFNHV
ncbi:MAG: pyrimidine dimer DNA glycosylase/endonuclease V [Chloroflexi bacterium]|nr:pyrimidine dimer DNA glycosylase/endonuclease V [Chloroflexota bacterium]